MYWLLDFHYEWKLRWPRYEGIVYVLFVAFVLTFTFWLESRVETELRNLGATGLNSFEEFILGQLRHHKHFLCTGAFAGKHFEAACYRYRNPQLKVWAVSTDPRNHPWGDRLNLRILSKNLEPGDQPFYIGAVRNNQAPHGELLLTKTWTGRS